MEGKIGEIFTTFSTEWKDQAVRAVVELIRTPPTSPPSSSYATFIQLKGLQDANSKLKEIVRTQHDQLTVLTAKHTKLQAAFRELETKAIVLETAYGMRAMSKEVKEFIFAQYVDTLKSKIEDVTRILELESLLESKGVPLPKRENVIFSSPFTEILRAQLEELSRVLLVEDSVDPTANILLVDEDRASLLAHVEAPPELASVIGELRTRVSGRELKFRRLLG
ncbi:hypothetical protein R1sor_000429 [Riccia sorocarpa]|uniref:Uncharacterized protein n=1 Tax=Riccia sorocarpa TaxID=122646 RepID=A0ABD3GVF9_9MARC